MGKQSNITVALIGIAGSEKDLLKLALECATDRQNLYRYVSLLEQPQILIVDSEAELAIAEWRGYLSAQKGRDEEPAVVMVYNEENSYTNYHELKRPLMAIKVISLLDKIVQDNPSLLSIPKNKRKEANAISADYKYSLDQDRLLNISDDYRILVVDDSLPVIVQIQLALQDYMKKENIDFAGTGEDACFMVEENHYNIIFLDIGLPGMDGYEVCKKIKQGNAKDSAVIMLTGSSSTEDRIKGKLSGCDTYLIKPVKKEIFYEVIRSFLSS